VQPRPATPELLSQVCSIGSEVREVKGSAQLKARSKDASGQFPAFIKANAATAEHLAQLKLEVQKPFGGAYAILTVDGTHYSVEVPSHPERNRVGQESWGGIPLVWATDLFLGKVPCPSTQELAQIQVSKNEAGDLVATRNGETFVYHFHSGLPGSGDSGPFWPDTVRWTKGDLVVDFKFEDIDRQTHSPFKWQATSANGEIKTQWRDRELH
jgi:hypothetical protein